MSLVDLHPVPGAPGVPGDGPIQDLGRTPPQDVAAEQSVLGGMMLSKDAIAEVVEVLRGSDFYRPAHEIVYEAVLDLYGRGEPADAVTVADELRKRGELGRVGGPSYLHTLISCVPTAANAGYYARIVHERSVLRRLVAAGTKIVQLGYAAEGGDVDVLVNAAQAEVYAVTERRQSEDYARISEIIEATIDEIEAASNHGTGLVGVPTGFADLDRLTNGLHPGQMIVIAARPAVGKSTLGLDIARSASIRHDLPAVIFSLEMSRTEITMRMLSAEARIPMQNMRKGMMRDEDWTRLAKTMGQVNEAPLFIDDSPNMSLMEIRAKCRRLKQRHGLKLVVVDYLQLMTSGKKVESRQQEVSEFSRALKLLAKELEVPVIAISQLNRGPEQRTDKKPMVSDLRESGCLTADTRVLRADTGAEVTLGELHAGGATDVPVWSLDSTLRYVLRHLTHVFPTGTKPVFRLALASGKTVRATGNHPFLTYDGWTPLAAVPVGTRVAVPRHVPAPRALTVLRDDDVVAIGQRLAALGEGVPSDAAALPKRQIALLLRTLFGARGEVILLDAGDPAEADADADAAPGRAAGLVRLRATGREQLDGVAGLLLRFGISCRVERAERVERWVLTMDDRDDVRRFLGEIGFAIALRTTLARADALLAAVQAQSRPEGELSGGGGHAGVWSRVREVLIAEPELVAAGGAASFGADPCSSVAPHTGGQRMARVASLLAQAQLDVHAVNDVVWDEVVAVEPDGVEEVFDATVLGTHNFIANGLAVHNSIEQDADMVILLHREDMYEKESPRAGEADFIVAKHRNGPTDTITVAFQGHYSRFVDMAT